MGRRTPSLLAFYACLFQIHPVCVIRTCEHLGKSRDRESRGHEKGSLLFSHFCERFHSLKCQSNWRLNTRNVFTLTAEHLTKHMKVSTRKVLKLLRGQFTQKWRCCHHFLILVSFQTSLFVCFFSFFTFCFPLFFLSSFSPFFSLFPFFSFLSNFFFLPSKLWNRNTKCQWSTILPVKLAISK